MSYELLIHSQVIWWYTYDGTLNGRQLYAMCSIVTGYWLRFYVPLDIKQVISETLPEPISWLGMEKQNLTQQNHTLTYQKKCTTKQNKHKKLKPGLVAS